ncbi:hypothetical protein L1049_011453 [Liquidambar formosana]|uniref:Uncharacterized protein n=1 Tax=Liquidambar formosana TaxID=63359 RepID=A0AAP0RWB8_LIQFO
MEDFGDMWEIYRQYIIENAWKYHRNFDAIEEEEGELVHTITDLHRRQLEVVNPPTINFFSEVGLLKRRMKSVNLVALKYRSRRPSGASYGFTVEEKLKTKLARESGSVDSIYKVPTNMSEVEPKAFDPNIISSGPYRYGVPRLLQAMKELKLQYFRRLFIPSRQSVVKLDTLKEAMKKSEQEARSKGEKQRTKKWGE